LLITKVLRKNEPFSGYLEMFANNLFADMHSNCVGLIKTVDTNSRLNFGRTWRIRWKNDYVSVSVPPYAPLSFISFFLFIYMYLSLSRRQTGAEKKQTQRQTDKLHTKTETGGESSLVNGLGLGPGVMHTLKQRKFFA